MFYSNTFTHIVLIFSEYSAYSGLIIVQNLE